MSIDLKFTEEDHKRADVLMQRERIHEITEDKLFESSIYCILSIRENYKSLMDKYRLFQSYGLNNHQSMIENPEMANTLMKRAGLNKPESLKRFVEWWPKNNVYNMVQECISDNDDESTISLRNKLGDKKDGMPGVGYKCASLLLNTCGIESVAPIDIWIMRFLKENKFDIHSDYLHKVRGLTSLKTYTEYENHLKTIAEDNGYSPAELHKIIWAKNSTFNQDTIHAKQYDLDF